MHRGCARVFVIWEYACIELKLHFQSMNALEDFDVSTTCTIRLAAENLSKWLENENLINCNYVGDYKGECCHALNSHRDIWSLPPYARARADKLKRSVIDGGVRLLCWGWAGDTRIAIAYFVCWYICFLLYLLQIGCRNVSVLFKVVFLRRMRLQ